MQVLRNDPNNSDALYYVAVIVQEGKHAEGQARTAGTRQGTLTHACTIFWASLSAIRPNPGGSCEFRLGHRMQPDFVDAHASRADVLADLGRLDEALPVTTAS